ncbi:MAG: hypothetical protein F6K58_10780 [Symploca sp. SIO2E9]|nr:hypothetical protein [Symploca sp. SIO2E9]
MIISDLSYLEVVEESNVVGGYGGVNVTKDVDIEVDVDLNFDANVDVDIDKDIDVNLDSTVDITGNFAQVIGDVTAIGNDSFAEIDFAVTVTDGLAEASVVATGAVG